MFEKNQKVYRSPWNLQIIVCLFENIFWCVFPQQQNAMGSLHNIDFGVFWASWGGSGNRFRELVPGTSSGNPFWVTGFPVPGKQFWEPGPGFDGFRQVLRLQETKFWTPRFRVQKVVCPRFRRFRCSIGSDGWVLFPRFGRNGFGEPVPETRGTKKVPGSGDSVPNVPKVTLCFEGMLCKLKVNFCTLKV